VANEKYLSHADSPSRLECHRRFIAANGTHAKTTQESSPTGRRGLVDVDGYARIRREMPLYADLARSASELSESAEVA